METTLKVLAAAIGSTIAGALTVYALIQIGLRLAGIL